MLRNTVRDIKEKEYSRKTVRWRYGWRAIAVNRGIYMELTQRADDRFVDLGTRGTRGGGRKLGGKERKSFWGEKLEERPIPDNGPGGIKRGEDREGYIWSDNDNAQRALLCVLRWRSPLVRINCVQPDRPRWPNPPIKTIDRYLTHVPSRSSHFRVLSFPTRSPETTDKYPKYPRNGVISSEREANFSSLREKHQRLRLIS